MTLAKARETVLEVLRLTWDDFNPATDSVAIHAWNDPPLRKRHTIVGFRVAEVDFTRTLDIGMAGSSYMQVDVPHGLVVCAAVERAVIALVEEWENPFLGDPGSEGDALSEQREELWRLAFAVTDDADRAGEIAYQVMPMQEQVK